MVNLFLIAVGAGLVTAIAEAIHLRRVHRIRHMAFGSRGRPALWVGAVPLARSVAVGALAWGMLYLLTAQPQQRDERPKGEASKHLLICLDVSPSMHVEDAGPNVEKVSRAVWAGELTQAILDRLDMETTRVTVVAVYTDALPVIEETFDKAIITNVLDGLPMYAAFQPGGTNLHKGIDVAMEHARPWPAKSATLVVITDGDASASAPTRFIPASIADAIVVGVGDPHRSTMVGGHSSRQDTSSLKLLASRLGGTYHQGNVKHLPSSVLRDLSMIQPRLSDSIGLREIALIAVTSGSIVIAGLGPALAAFGRPIAWRRRRGGPGFRDRLIERAVAGRST